MYLDTTASRANQHRAAMEKHARAARQVKAARAAAPCKSPKAPAQQSAPALGLRGWAVTAFARKTRPAVV
jgi:hypothetical protein